MRSTGACLPTPITVSTTRGRGVAVAIRSKASRSAALRSRLPGCHGSVIRKPPSPRSEPTAAISPGLSRHFIVSSLTPTKNGRAEAAGAAASSKSETASARRSMGSLDLRLLRGRGSGPRPERYSAASSSVIGSGGELRVNEALEERQRTSAAGGRDGGTARCSRTGLRATGRRRAPLAARRADAVPPPRPGPAPLASTAGRGRPRAARRARSRASS